MVAGNETAAGAGAKTAAAGAGGKTAEAGAGAKAAEAAGGGAKTAAGGGGGANTSAGAGASAAPPEAEAPKENAVLVLAGSFVAPIEPNTKPDFDGGLATIPANAEGVAAAVPSAVDEVFVRLYDTQTGIGKSYDSWLSPSVGDVGRSSPLINPVGPWRSARE